MSLQTQNASENRLEPSKGSALPVVIDGYVQTEGLLRRRGTHTKAENNLAGFAEIEIFKLLERDTFKIQRQHVIEALVQLCYPIRSKDTDMEWTTIRFYDGNPFLDTKMTIVGDRNTNYRAITKSVQIDAMFPHPIADHVGYQRNNILNGVLNEFGWGNAFPHAIAHFVPLQFRQLFEKKMNTGDHQDAVRLYVEISLRMQFAIGRRIATSWSNTGHGPAFHGHLNLIQRFLEADRLIWRHFDQLITHIFGSFSPDQVMKIQNFHNYQASVRQEMQNALIAFGHQNHPFTSFFNIERKWDGDYLVINKTPPMPNVPYVNLSLYKALDTTIQSQDWQRIFHTTSTNKGIEIVLLQMRQCMQMNLDYLSYPDMVLPDPEEPFGDLIESVDATQRNIVPYLWMLLQGLIAEKMLTKVNNTMRWMQL